MIKVLTRILLAIGLILAAVVALLAGSIIVDTLLGRSRVEAVTNTTIPSINGSPEVRAYVAKPQGSGPFPTVIMIHEFYGLNQNIVEKAEGLAQEGYLVIAPDTFRGSSTAWVPRAIFQVITNDADQVNQDLDSVYQWLISQPDVDAERIATLGFCYGGRASLGYSLHNNRLAATLIFYGSPVTDPAVLRSLPGPVLGIFGGADNSIPTEEVRDFEAALAKAGIPNQITIYEGQPHAFITSMEAVRAGGVQGEAWAQMLDFLDANLKQAPGASGAGAPSAYQPPFDWRYYLAIAYEHAFGSASHTH